MNLFKKATATLALVTLLSGVFSTGVSAYSSAEVEAANYLATAGIVVDHKDNPAAYNLDQNVLRQEIAAVARGIAGLPKKTTCDGVFKDVSATKPNDWACYTVEQLADNGLIALNENFRPEDNISKAEAIGMVVKAAFGDEYMYDASKTTTWQQQVVAFAVANGVTSNFVNYDTPATRGFVFSAGANAMEVIVKGNGGEDLTDIMCQLLGICEENNSNTGSLIESPDPSNENPSVVVTGGGVEISLNPKSPAAQTVPQTGLLPFGKFDFTAGREDVTISQITVLREGLSERADIRRVYFEKNGVRISNRTSIAMDDTAVITFTPAFTIKAGSTETLDLVVELKEAGAQIGAEHRFAVVSADDVDASVSVGGTFPVRTALMRVGSYRVATINVTSTKSDTTYTVGQENALLAEFKVENTGEKDDLFKSVALRNNGTADAGSSLSNIALYADGKKVSTELAIVGRDITVYANDTILNGKSKIYELRADITGAERNPETYGFQIRNTSDLTIVEEVSGFSAPIDLTNAGDTKWSEVTVEGGDFLISRDTSYNLNQTVSQSTSDVVMWAAKLNVREDINVEDATFQLDISSSGSLSDFNSFRLQVGDVTVATFTPAAGQTIASGGTITVPVTFESSFTIRGGASSMKILGNINSKPFNNAKYAFQSNITFADSRYVSNDEEATPAGGAAGIATTVANGALTLVRNDGIDNSTLVAGTNDKLLLGFTLRADDVSNVRISAIKPTITAGANLGSYVSNFRLYQNNQLVKTANNPDFNGLDITINKNQSAEFKILADFSNSINLGSSYQLSVSSGSVTARNLDSSNQVYATGTATSELFVFSDGGKAVVTRNSSQTVASLLTPSTSETEVFKFDIEADDDNIMVTDVYVSNVYAATGSGYFEVLPTANALKEAAIAAASGVTTNSGDVVAAATSALTGTGADALFDAAIVATLSGTNTAADAIAALRTIPVNQTTFTMLATAATVVPKANLIEAIRSSVLEIDGNKFTGDMFSTDVIHFGLGSNGLLVKRDLVATGVVRVSFHDSANRTNQGIQLAITTANPTGNVVTGTMRSMRILSESTGTEIERNDLTILGNTHRLVRSKPVVTMVSFSHSSTDLYKFTVTADANRKITLNDLTFVTSGSANMAGTTINVYRDSNGGSANLVGSGTVYSTGSVVDMSYGANNQGASAEIAGGNAVTFYAQIIGTPTKAAKDDRREVQITSLTYFDDATPQTVIDASSLNIGLPTSIDSYTY